MRYSSQRVKYIPKIKRSPESVRLEIHGDGLDVPNETRIPSKHN